MNRLSRGAVVGAILVPLVTAGFIAQESSTRDGARLFGQVLDLVGTRFVDTVSAADLYEKAARGLVEQLQDPYSDLLSPKQLAMFNTTTGGRYGGLGMQIEEQKGKGVTVARVFPHTPAERSGIREGDVIVAIDSASSQGWNTTRVSDVLKGTPGTKVNVTFARPGVTSPINVTFTRAIIKVPAVPYAILLDDSIGYIPLQQFNESAHGDLAAGVKQLQSDGAKSLVIDLRGNPGGYLEQALEISNLFQKKTDLVAEHGPVIVLALVGGHTRKHGVVRDPQGLGHLDILLREMLAEDIDHEVGRALLRRALLERTVDRDRGDRWVVVLGDRGAQRRARGLQVGGVAGVDGSAHGGGSLGQHHHRSPD